MFYVKLHVKESGTVLAVCDEELLGVRLESDGRKIDVSEKFYKGELVSETELICRMREAPVINIMGNRAVNVAMREGLVSEDGFITVADIRHAQVVR